MNSSVAESPPSPGAAAAAAAATASRAPGDCASASTRAASYGPPDQAALPRLGSPPVQHPAAMATQLPNMPVSGLMHLQRHQPINGHPRVPDANSPPLYYASHVPTSGYPPTRPVQPPPAASYRSAWPVEQQQQANRWQFNSQPPMVGAKYSEHNYAPSATATSPAFQEADADPDAASGDEESARQDETSSAAAPDDEDEAEGGDERPAGELEERVGERSYSENQADATERDRDGRPVRVYQRHLVNGRPVEGKESGGREQAADFDSVVNEIDEHEQQQQPTGADYDEAPDGSQLQPVVGAADESRSSSGRRIDSAADRSRSSRGGESNKRRARGGPLPERNGSRQQHRLSESLRAQQWDDDSTLAKTPRGARVQQTSGNARNDDRQNDHDRNDVDADDDDSSRADEMEAAAAGEQPVLASDSAGLELDAPRRANRKRRQVKRAAAGQPSGTLFSQINSRVDDQLRGQVRGAANNRRSSPKRQRRARRQAPDYRPDPSAHGGHNQPPAHLGSSFGERIVYQQQQQQQQQQHSMSAPVMPQPSATPASYPAYDYPLQPPPTASTSQPGGFQVTITTNADGTRAPVHSPPASSYGDYNVVAPPVQDSQPASTGSDVYPPSSQQSPAFGQQFPPTPPSQSNAGTDPAASYAARYGERTTVDPGAADWPRRPPELAAPTPRTQPSQVTDWQQEPSPPMQTASLEHRRPADRLPRQPLVSESKRKKKVKFKKSNLHDSKYKAAKAHSSSKASKMKKGGMKKKKRKAKKRMLKKSKQFHGSTRGKKGQKGGGQQGANKGALYYKDHGFKKRGFKKVYKKLEAGDHKTYFDEFRDKDHKKKWKKFKDKHHYSQNKNWSGNESKKYKNYNLNEHKDKKSRSGHWNESARSKYRKDYNKKSGSSKKKKKRKEKDSHDY